MPDPASWLVVEKGWKVVASDGTEVGTVEETIGDSNRDIFDGIAVATGLFEKHRYVPAEQVAEIVEGEVRLALAPDEIERLGKHEQPPPSTQIRPE